MNNSVIIMISDENVEIPGDLSWMVYTTKDNWEFEMLKELNATGIKIDMNKLPLIVKWNAVVSFDPSNKQYLYLYEAHVLRHGLQIPIDYLWHSNYPLIVGGR